MKKVKVGYFQTGYPAERNIIFCKPEQVRLVKLERDILGRSCDIIFKSSIFEAIYIRIKVLFSPAKNINVDIIHTFNAVCRTKTPWIVTCEGGVPLFGWKSFWGRLWSYYNIRLLAKDNCKKIICISECCYRWQTELIKKCSPYYEKKIMDKCIVLHPAQQMLIANEKEIEQKYLNIEKEIEFLFIGRNFWRKGGEAAVDILSHLRKQICVREEARGISVKLTIVSSLEVGDESRLIIQPDKNAARLRQYFQDNNDWVTWYKELDNEDVLKLCKKAHVGLLPTSSETYGYSVLEMQAGGTPVITTNIMALPEINNQECGWLLDLEKRNDKGAALNDEKFRSYSKKILYKELEACLGEIIQNPTSIKEKAIMAYRRIQDQHSLKKYRESLMKIYK